MIQCGPPSGNWRSSGYKGAAVSLGRGMVSGEPIIQQSGTRYEDRHNEEHVFFFFWSLQLKSATS